jgi:cytidylate kinase
MRRWAIDLQTRQKLAEETAKTQVPDLIHPYVAISRESGVNANELAHAVAAECGCDVLDRELIDHLAEHDHLSRLALEFVDERTVSWFHEVFGKWLEGQLVSQAEYVQRLGRIVLLAAQHKSSVFVGRGVQFMLPRDRGFAVRIIAPLKQRIECIATRNNCNERTARRTVEETDANRAHFVERYFHHDITDAHLYDLIVNLESIPRPDAVQLIATEVNRHFERIRTQSSTRNSVERQMRRIDQWSKRKWS